MSQIPLTGTSSIGSGNDSYNSFSLAILDDMMYLGDRSQEWEGPDPGTARRQLSEDSPVSVSYKNKKHSKMIASNLILAYHYD